MTVQGKGGRPKNYPELIGKKFNSWTIVEHYRDYERATTCVDVVCDCGQKRDGLRLYDVRAGRSKSCGCKSKESIRLKVTKHGFYYHKLYPTYKAMVSRCSKEIDKNYHNYGGRGIKVCDRWLEPSGKGFLNFLEDMGERPEGLTLERVDVNSGYSPENCVWASVQEQSLNKRNSRKLEYKGDVRCLSEWCDLFGVDAEAVSYRLNKGWSIEKAFDTPFRPKKLFFKVGGKVFKTSEVFQAAPNHHERAKRIGIAFSEYCATLLNPYGVVVETQNNSERVIIEPLDIDLPEINTCFTEEFKSAVNGGKRDCE